MQRVYISAVAQVVEFQYPLTDRGGCNENTSRFKTSEPAFQYPLTDRGGCNSWTVERATGRVIVFQYPLTDRGGCNKIFQLFDLFS